MGDLTPVQRAYGMLWRDLSTSQLVNSARHELFDFLTEDERRAGIQWVRENWPVTERELIAADIRDGIFPKRSS